MVRKDLGEGGTRNGHNRKLEVTSILDHLNSRGKFGDGQSML